MNYDQKVEDFYIKKIEDNKDILLSSFGYLGISHSENKIEIVKDVLETVNDVTIRKVIGDFFNTLGEYYLKETPICFKSRNEISDLIAEERKYAIAKLDNVEVEFV